MAKAKQQSLFGDNESNNPNKPECPDFVRIDRLAQVFTLNKTGWICNKWESCSNYKLEKCFEEKGKT
jgi:hypothetical protein